MKRSPLPPRKNYLPRSKKPIPARRKDPAKRAWAKHRDWTYWNHIKTLPCTICGRWPVDPAHLKKRSRGSDDRKNLVPLCREHHDEQEGKIPAFEKRHGVDLTAVALRLDAEYSGEEWA